MVFDKLFEKKVKEVQEDTIFFKESHPVISMAGSAPWLSWAGPFWPRRSSSIATAPSTVASAVVEA